MQEESKDEGIFAAARPWLRGQGARKFGGDTSDPNDKLFLSNAQYYQLLELLTFNIYLP